MREKVKIRISARHVHLTNDAIKLLFGHELTVKNYLNQVGQFAANETVNLKTPDGIIENVRVVGPARSYNQVEISRSDARKLKINPPVRRSGDINNSEVITIMTAKGEITQDCCIIADRHVHFSLDDAKKYGVNDGEDLKLTIGGEKPGVIMVKAKVSADGFFEVHLDTDDANAFLIQADDIGILRR